MKRIVLAAIVISTICAAVFAQEVSAPAPEAKQRFDIGAGYWYTSGNLDSFVYDSTLGGEKISELNYDLDTGLFIVNAEAYLFWRLYADGFVGWGDFEGEHEDSDWDPTVSTAKMQMSESDADGDVTVWNVNGYIRLLEKPEDKGYLDFALGYLYYQDDIEHIRNTTITILDWEAVSIPLEGHDSQDQYTYDGLRLGVRGKVRLNDRIAIKASGGICPFATMKEELFWNLREDFGPPPGMETDVEADATIFDLNIALEFKITKNLFIEGGYKYFNLDSDIGDEDRSWLSGVSITFEDAIEADAERGGFYVMGRLKI